MKLLRLFLPWLPLAGLAAAAPPSDEAELLFVRRIQPLFQERCVACHGKDGTVKSGYDMRTAEAAFKGGESGEAAIVAGDAEKSPLYLAVTRAHEDDWKPMPPKEADKLYAEQIGYIKQWIDGGAPWPEEARVLELTKANTVKWSAEDGVTVKTSGGLSPEWTNRRYKPEGLWAYHAVQPPKVELQAGENPVDALLGLRMPEGLHPAPATDARTFIRRATYDLTGLPPAPEEVTDFEAAWKTGADAAIAALVERLLASPHYGERMAQHWLDVVRYADTSGFANDFERGNAWRYRDYVVRSFNQDKRYDQFVQEQLAGDELDPNDPEKVVATGFLRMGPWELTGMEVPKVARQRFLDDVSNGVGETFLAHSLQCARCHDHKFDPIPTRDYYSVQAVFATTQLVERPTPFSPAENTAGFEEKKYLELSRGEALSALRHFDDVMLNAAPNWFREKGIDPAIWNAAVVQAQSNKEAKGSEGGGTFEAARKLLAKQGLAEDQYPPKLYGFTPADYGGERVARKSLERLRWELERYEPVAFAVYDGRTPDLKAVTSPLRMPVKRMTEGELEETTTHAGGDPFVEGVKVKPGVLSVLGALEKGPIPESIEGRRKAFASWVASPANPLTTRAIANRIWLWHFGQAIAGNPNNFGSTGKRPSHPELLDWLASTFVQQGWSFKAMHRVIMTSQAYRRSTTHPDLATLTEKDPTGLSYAVFKPRRLTAEELRDTMLADTGELNPTLGGIPNRPEINMEAALQPRQVMGTFASAWVPNPLPAQRNRRSIYALKVRGLPDPQMEVFNQPTPDFSCERRDASTVTPQVFTLFNGQNTHARALALAHRARTEAGTDQEALARCFALAFGRPPTAQEQQRCLQHWSEIEAMIVHDTPTDAKPPLEVRREAVEENTGERFAFQEKLFANADYVPDLQPGDVDLHTRALADVCLALFNSNEFAYVY